MRVRSRRRKAEYEAPTIPFIGADDEATEPYVYG
jgi:hypothetical protein